MQESVEIQTEEQAKKLSPRLRMAIIALGALLLIVGLPGAAVVVSETYHKDRIFHGVFLGPLDLGGLKREEARDIIEAWHDQWWVKEMVYQAYDERKNLLTTVDFQPIIIAEGGQSFQFIWYDLDAMLEKAYAQGRHQSVFKRAANQVGLLREPVILEAELTIDEERLLEVLRLELSGYETQPMDAGIMIQAGVPKIVSEQPGNTFDYHASVVQTYKTLRAMKSEAIPLHRSHHLPAISTQEVQAELVHYQSMQSSFPLRISYFDERIGFERDWQLGWPQAIQAVQVIERDGQPFLGLDAAKLDAFFKEIESVVNEQASDAKFTVGENGKVELFLPAEKGYTLDRAATAESLNAYIEQRRAASNEQEPQEVALVVQTIDPGVKTADVNDLGITEVLGVGYSNFGGSPANRVHNISVGAAKLDGLLIAPGEEFSLLNALRPFTVTAGYLPELVIKGDKITPEVGGGLCQIGSTTFRAAMNSGLSITERRNHSLVVSYYNDPRNGNPGTDATIYDGSPDFKFINDTGHHILIKTEMNRSNGDLYFTFWGTSDGRKAEYTEPVVSRWIPTGPTKYIETTDLAPGEQKCQGAHPGAVASFVYKVTKPDGTVQEQEYVSQYRPLPTICLVGIDPNKTEATETQSETGEGAVQNAQPESQPVA